MKIRRFNVNRMRRHAARSTPDFIILEVSVTELERLGEAGMHRLFRYWMDKMRIKHLGKRRRIEFFQEHLINRNVYRVSARVVEDPYARPIQLKRSLL